MNQAGNGYPYFHGNKYQKGHSWFGRLFSKGVLPLIKYMGKHAVKTGMNVVKDVAMGENLKDASKKHIKSTVHTITDDAIDKVSQIGSGKPKAKKNIAKRGPGRPPKKKGPGRPLKKKGPGRPPKPNKPGKLKTKTVKSKNKNLVKKKEYPDWLK